MIGECLSVPESDFPEPVVAHESALVHISVDSIESAFTRVLPHLEVASVLKNRCALGVLRNHEFIAVELAQKVMIVEVGSGINERLLLVGFFYKQQKLEKGVAEFLCVHSALCLDVYHGQQVLIAWTALSHEVLELCLLWNASTVEMVRTNLESVSVGKVYILFVFAVYIGPSLCSLEINIRHFGVVAYGFPEHISLIVAEVDAMHMLASILTLYELCVGAEGE